MFEKLILRLASVEAQPQLALLGLLSGVFSGGVIVLFRLVVEIPQRFFLPELDHFEGLSGWSRFLLAVAGAGVVGLLIQFSRPETRSVGVVHVMTRLSYYQGHLPFRNLLHQFAGAALCVISGQSVGREGPGIHLGAASSSLIGQRIGVPRNSLRSLVACGTAAAIAASFNTPIAGVIFAMEVVMMEYTIAGFTPVILAAVSGALVSRLVFGPEPAFLVPALEMESFWDLPWLVLLGTALGTLSALFIRLIKASSRFWPDGSPWLRATLGGTVTGICALLAPQVSGIGYDTVSAVMLGQMSFGILALIVALKLVATTVGLGLGLPGGLIGPTLFIGACAGGALGIAWDFIAPEHASSAGFYAMIGMGAMMSATLRAPLAALMALLELTANPNVILPAMLAIVIANLMAREVFGQDSVFLELMRARGLDYRNDPVAQSLRRVGVAAVMDRDFTQQPRHLGREHAEAALADNPRWVLIRDQGRPVSLLPAADLAFYLAESEAPRIDLMDIPGRRQDLAPVDFQANLQEALDILESNRLDALYVEKVTAPLVRRVYGVLTRETLEGTYRYRPRPSG